MKPARSTQSLPHALAFVLTVCGCTNVIEGRPSDAGADQDVGVATSDVAGDVAPPSDAASSDLADTSPDVRHLGPVIGVEFESDITVSEGEPGVSAKVRLTAQPAADVTLTPIAHDEVTAQPLTIAADGWQAWHAVSVEAVADLTAELREVHVLEFAATSEDPQADGVVASLSVEISDNDVAEVIVTNTGTTYPWQDDVLKFDVQLNAAPDREVLVELDVVEYAIPWQPDNGYAAPAAMLFTAENWNVPQSGRMGVEWSTFYDEAGRTLEWRTLTDDPAYALLTSGTTTVRGNFIDDEFFLHPIAGAWPETAFVFEGGPPTPIHIQLGYADTEVLLELLTTHPEFAHLSRYLITPDCDHCLEQVDLSVDEDNDVTGPSWIGVGLRPTYSSERPYYSETRMPGVPVLLVDNDVYQLVASLPEMELNERLARRACTQLVLSRAPAAAVSFDVSSADASEAIVDVAAVVFDSSNWNVPREVCVLAQDDTVGDGPQQTKITFGPSTSSDPEWNGIRTDLPVRVTDDETPGLTAYRKRYPIGFETPHGRHDAPVWLFPNTMSPDPIPVQISSSSPNRVADESIADIRSWRHLRAGAVHDDVPQPRQTIVLSGDADPGYANSPFTVETTVLDLTGGQSILVDRLWTYVDDPPKTVAVWLSRAPNSVVTVPLTCSRPELAVPSPTTLTFDSTNWSTPQLVSINAGPTPWLGQARVLVGPAVSADPSFDGQRGWSLQIQ